MRIWKSQEHGFITTKNTTTDIKKKNHFLCISQMIKHTLLGLPKLLNIGITYFAQPITETEYNSQMLNIPIFLHSMNVVIVSTTVIAYKANFPR